ncbi:prephenate dehydratase [candidate division KSB1 bacterium]|nr:prephenate dehydratase [candidate division KSB1 bacterium]
MKKIAFQGEKGAFSEDAAYHFFSNNINPVPHKTFKEVFDAVASGTAEYGMIPIENSFTGSIHQNMDLLLEFDVSVIGEIILRIHHNLLAPKGIPIGEIRRVYSHPQALGQCSIFLDSMENVEIIPMYDTAGSAKRISEQSEENAASIASIRAAKDYGLHVLKKGIENNDQNFTRFLVISQNSILPEKHAKTSIVFSAKDIPGALFKSLSVFALRDINLLKIESRPLRKGKWTYWFYLDFEGSLKDEACQNAMNHLSEITSFLKVLGSYETGKVVK